MLQVKIARVSGDLVFANVGDNSNFKIVTRLVI